MKKEFLGDVYDHWKGSLIRQLNTAKLLQDLLVFSMITDRRENEGWWDKDDFRSYANLLGVEVEQILQSELEFNHNISTTYFHTNLRNDVFVDPDTGIEPAQSKPKHIKIRELCQLLTLIPFDWS